MKIILPAFLTCLCCQGLFCQDPSAAAKPAKSTEIYFDFGKHDLRPAADSSLAQLVAFAKGKDNFSIKITAHTDSIGSLANNEALSNRRAHAVKDFFIKNGLAAEHISFAFFGEKMPASVNDTEENRQKNRRATVEIFLVRPSVTIEGTVTDETTGLPLPADVIIHTKESADTLHTGTDGRFQTTVLPGTVVGIDAFAKCYFMRTDMVKARPKMTPVLMPLKPAKNGAIADIDKLFFIGDQAILVESTKEELPKILGFLNLNPGMKIEIAGHMNFPNNPPVKKDSWEFRLSEARAKTVYDYLVEQQIAPERVSWKGYGNHEMRFPRTTIEAEQAQNRRVEIRVLEGGCE